MRFHDGLTNAMAGLGTARDKANHVEFTGYNAGRIVQYIRMYEDSDIARFVVDQLGDDATRKWRSWQGDKDVITKLEAEEKRLGVRDKIKGNLCMSRLVGVNYLLLDIQDGQTPDKPVNLNRVGLGGLRFIVPLSYGDVSPGEIDTDPLSPGYGYPMYYSIASASASTVELTRIHPSRMIRWHGRERPSISATGKEGMSILAGMESPIMQYEALLANIASLVYEAKVDVISIPGLLDLLKEPEQERAFRDYMTAAMTAKGNNGTLLLPGDVNNDIKGASYDQKTMSFATLPELVTTYERALSAKSGYPHALRFGRQGGLGNNGDMELASYYDRVGEIQSNDIEPKLYILDECLIRSALGKRPADLWYEWVSLWQQSDKEKVENADKLASAVQKIVSAGVIPAEVLSEPTVNGLAALGVLPGIETKYEEFTEGGGEIDEPESEDDVSPVVKDWVKPKMAAELEFEGALAILDRLGIAGGDIETA